MTTHIIANTQAEGKYYAKMAKIPSFKVLSTTNAIRGKRFEVTEAVIILTNNTNMINTLLPALNGAHVLFDSIYVSAMRSRWHGRKFLKLA